MHHRFNLRNLFKCQWMLGAQLSKPRGHVQVNLSSQFSELSMLAMQQIFGFIPLWLHDAQQ